jgi:hypothetical protein
MIILRHPVHINVFKRNYGPGRVANEWMNEWMNPQEIEMLLFVLSREQGRSYGLPLGSADPDEFWKTKRESIYMIVICSYDPALLQPRPRWSSSLASPLQGRDHICQQTKDDVG